MDNEALLKNIYTGLVLILASQLKEQKKAKGVTSTSDYVDEAIRLIDQKAPTVFQARR